MSVSPDRPDDRTDPPPSDRIFPATGSAGPDDRPVQHTPPPAPPPAQSATPAADHDRTLVFDNPASAASLVPVALVGRHRPIDRALDRLEADDGARLFARLAALPPIADAAPDAAAFVGFPPGLETLERLKARSKRILGSPHDADERDRAVLGYFIAVAAALSAHGRLISSQPIASIEPVLLDLAELAPEPWSRLFAEAAGRLETA